jgi:hypothetical protein
MAYFYTNDYFEAELLSLEIQRRQFQSLQTSILTANKVYESNVTDNLSQNILQADMRKETWDKASGITELYPDRIMDVLNSFGQNMVDRAISIIKAKEEKPKGAPKMPKPQKYSFNFDNGEMEDTVTKTHQIKRGTMHVKENGLEFINSQDSRDNFFISDYDELHGVIFKKKPKIYTITFKGRKIQELSKDDNESRDPMNLLHHKKSNWSDQIKKHLLLLSIRTVDISKKSGVPSNGEV